MSLVATSRPSADVQWVARDGFKTLETRSGYRCDSFMLAGNRWECRHGVVVWPEQVAEAAARAAGELS